MTCHVSNKMQRPYSCYREKRESVSSILICIQEREIKKINADCELKQIRSSIVCEVRQKEIFDSLNEHLTLQQIGID